MRDEPEYIYTEESFTEGYESARYGSGLTGYANRRSHELL